MVDTGTGLAIEFAVGVSILMGVLLYKRYRDDKASPNNSEIQRRMKILNEIENDEKNNRNNNTGGTRRNKTKQKQTKRNKNK
jgi:hypothetical protein